MTTEIIIALIGLVASSLAPIATIVTHRSTKKDLARIEMKNSILQMILEDEFGWETYGKIPVNYQNILHDFDIYKANKGNSYIEDKVEDYKKWFHEVESSEKKEDKK